MKPFYFLFPSLCFIALSVNAQVSLSTINVSHDQNFNSLAASGTANEIITLPGGWLFTESGSNANTTYAAGTGSGTAGNTYSFGLDADRAFGGLQSGTLIPTLGAGFINETGSRITSIQITYKGEQWRLGTSGRGSDRLDFQYSLNATSLTTGTWTNVDDLDFSSLVTVGPIGALNGNATGNNSTITFTLEGLSLEDGTTFFIRWNDFNVSGADDGLAIDDFSILPIGIPPTDPSIFFTPATLAFGDVNVGSSKVLKYEVDGDNLESPITASVSHAFYTLSTDSILFSSTAGLPDSGGTLFVKFSPTVNGPADITVSHTSGAFSKDFDITGSGFEQSLNIIPISVARTKSVGTKVTVAGRITVANEHGNPAYVQDETGGIPVFDFNLATTAAIGDSVWVTGPIGMFNDQKQISGTGIFHTKIAAAPRILSPKPITISELAANEGLLVSVQNVELVNKSFVFYPQSTERITDGTREADLRIDGDTDIPGLVKPQAAVNIIGVVGRFRTNAQLLPRFQADVPGAVEPSLPSDSIPKNETLDVVNWNLEFFGARSEDYRNEEFGPSNEALQLHHIKRVIDSLDADILAVQEVSNDSLFTILVSQLGRYSFICSDRYSRSFEGPGDEFPPQKVCFIYDTTTVDILSARAMFEARYDSARTIDPSLLPGIPGGASSFYSSGRLPYLVRVNATINGVTETVSLVNVHAKSGAATDDRSRREYDASVLYDSLNAHFSSDQLIFLGDLNDDLDQSIATGFPTPYASFVNDTTNYLPVTKTLSDAGARSTVGFGDVIDHQIITNELQSEYVNGSVQIITPFRFIHNYADSATDHLPVITRYVFQKPVVQFTQSTATVTEDSSQYTVHVTLDKPVTVSKQLHITLNGGAIYGDDLTINPPASGGQVTLTLEPGDSIASMVVTIIDDQMDELPEAVTFELMPDAGLSIGELSTFTLIIEDNDIPVVAFLERHASAEEGSGPYAIKLKLSTPPATDQTVTLWFGDGGPQVTYGSDYVTEPEPEGKKIIVTIPAGSDEGQFTITPLPDRKREKHGEYVAFYLTETSAGLQPEAPRFSFFTIIDKKRHPHFAVFPNPTKALFRLIADEVDDEESIYVEIRNDRGERIFRESGTLEEINEKITRKFHHARKGIYMMTVVLDDETYLIRIVKH